MLVRSLVSKGFACCEAEDGLEALSEMSRSSNQATRKFVAPFPSFMSPRPSIVSHASVAGGGGVVSSHSPGPPVLSLSTVGRQKLSGAACTNKLVASQIQHYSIDAVLIDYNMPKMNGPECIVELRNMGMNNIDIPHPINTPYPLLTHPINPSYQHTISTHPIPYQHTFTTHPVNPPYQPILSTHPINPPYPLLTHPINPSYQPTLSTHHINPP